MRRSLPLSAALFVGLLAATFWLLRARAPEPPAPFFALRERLPDTLTLAYAGDTTVVVPGGGGWQVVRPVDYPADPVWVEALVRRLNPLQVAEVYPLPPEKLETYGFRMPRAMLRAAYEGGLPPDTLWVGGFTLDASYDYVRSGSRGEAGLLESGVSRGFLLKRTEEIRDTRLLPFHETRARAFRLLAGGRVRFEAAWDSTGAWRVLRPYPGPAEAGKVREYLTSAAHMHVRSFLRDGGGPLAPYGLDSPRAGIEVETDGGLVLGAFLGARIPGSDLVAAVTRARPHVFGVSDKYVPFLAEPADAFRRRGVVTFGLADVDSVRVEGPGGSWAASVAGLGPEDRELLGRWVLLQATGFLPAGPETLRGRGLAAPRGTLQWFHAGSILAGVELGTAADGERALRVASGPEARPFEVLLVPEREIGPLWERLAARLAR